MDSIKEIDMKQIYDPTEYDDNMGEKWRKYIESIKGRNVIIVIIPITLNFESRCYEIPRHMLSEDLIRNLVPYHNWSKNSHGDIIHIDPTHICSANPYMLSSAYRVCCIFPGPRRETPIPFASIRDNIINEKHIELYGESIDCLTVTLLKRSTCPGCMHHTRFRYPLTDESFFVNNEHERDYYCPICHSTFLPSSEKF